MVGTILINKSFLLHFSRIDRISLFPYDPHLLR